MTDSDLRRNVLTAVAYGLAAAASTCIALAEWIRSESTLVLVATIVLAILLWSVFAAMVIRCVRIRSRVGKAEVSFIAVRSGEYKKEPPLRGKRPLR